MAKKTTSVQDVLSEMRQKDSITIGSLDQFDLHVEGISTGNLALDYLTGVGGFPKGRVVEAFGPPSSGKTTSALQAAAHLQKTEPDKYIVFMDYERTFDPEYAAALGLDANAPNFIYYQPEHFEDGANRFRKLLDTGEVGLVIFDSVAAMVSNKELEADTGSAEVMQRAKFLHQFMRQIKNALEKHGTTAIFLNHVMDLADLSPMGQKLASRGIKRQTTPGGKALLFYSSLRLEFKQIGNIRSSVLDELSNSKEDQIRSTRVQVTVVKNKVGDPFGTAELRVRFGKGFSQEFTVYQIVTSHGIVKKEAGGKFTFSAHQIPEGGIPKVGRGLVGDNWVRGEDTLLALWEQNPEWFDVFYKEAVAVLSKNDAFEKVDGSEYENDLDDELEGFSVDEETGELS